MLLFGVAHFIKLFQMCYSSFQKTLIIQILTTSFSEPCFHPFEIQDLIIILEKQHNKISCERVIFGKSFT